MTDFKKLFDNGDINEIISSKEGKLWLALRAISHFHPKKLEIPLMKF